MTPARPYAPHTWTPERDKVLTRRLAEGWSASEVAAELGVTRNSVIGRAGRLGVKLMFKSSDGPRVQRPRYRKPSGLVARPKERPVEIPAPRPQLRIPPATGPVSEPVSLNLSVMVLNGFTCKWPTSGEKEHTRFCGHLTWHGFPYCEFHSRRAHSPVPVRERSRELRGLA